jgi:hypothetical protein
MAKGLRRERESVFDRLAACNTLTAASTAIATSTPAKLIAIMCGRHGHAESEKERKRERERV